MNYYYLIILILAGLFSLAILWENIANIRKNRIASLKSSKTILPVDTESPVDQPRVDFQEEGAASITKRFSIIRKTLTALIFLLILSLAVFPTLETVPATMLSVFAGVLAVIVGITTRPFIENYISGVILGFNKTLKIGDTILIDEKYGTIEDITMTSTILKLWDWRRVIIPNSIMLSKEVVNYTLNDSFIWTKIEFRVSYDSDLWKVREIARDSAKQSPYFAGYEDPAFWIMSMEQHSYKCWLAAWSDSPARAWELGNEVRTRLITEFQASGIRSHGFFIDVKNKFNGQTSE